MPLGEAYEKIYSTICGNGVSIRPWHFRWHAVKDLHGDLREILTRVQGSVLDLGCGRSPYKEWLPNSVEYVGADVVAETPDVKLIIPGEPLPFDNEMFDCVLCTQVFEHVDDLSQLLAEVGRVVKRGGTLIVSVPFMYEQHGVPHDYRRFSRYGLQSELGKGYEVKEVRLQGGLGSSLSVLLLGGLEGLTNQNRTLRVVKGLAMPFWVLLTGLVNLFGLGVDALDRTGNYYHNVLCVAERKA